MRCDFKDKSQTKYTEGRIELEIHLFDYSSYLVILIVTPPGVRDSKILLKVRRVCNSPPGTVQRNLPFDGCTVLHSSLL